MLLFYGREIDVCVFLPFLFVCFVYYFEEPEGEEEGQREEGRTGVGQAHKSE